MFKTFGFWSFEIKICFECRISCFEFINITHIRSLVDTQKQNSYVYGFCHL